LHRTSTHRKSTNFLYHSHPGWQIIYFKWLSFLINLHECLIKIWCKTWIYIFLLYILNKKTLFPVNFELRGVHFWEQSYTHLFRNLLDSTISVWAEMIFVPHKTAVPPWGSESLDFHSFRLSFWIMTHLMHLQAQLIIKAMRKQNPPKCLNTLTKWYGIIH